MIKTRIAPSPTGFMHIGTLKTALTNFLLAQKEKGSFMLRLEDTDQSRFVEGSTEDLVQSLHWAGLTWEEGVDLDSSEKITEKGEFGPYVQSKRLSIYQEYAQKLIKEKKAYYCFCTPERLAEVRTKRQKEGLPPKYDQHCLSLTEDEIKEKLSNNTPYVIRLKVPVTGVTTFNDIVRGKVEISNQLLDDQVLLKSDGFPTYHLAVVVDDHLMQVTHVLRAEEWLPSTPKHILLYEAFGFPLPQFGHLPQLLNLNGKKLSKRDGDVSVRDFIEKGYPAQGLVNYIALLGWNPKTNQEIFTLEELIKEFDVQKINKAGAKFDYKRLDFVCSQHLKKIIPEEKLFKDFKAWEETFSKTIDWSKTPEEKIKKILHVQKERAATYAQLLENTEFFFKNELEYPAKLLPWKDQAPTKTKEKLSAAKEILEKMDPSQFNLESLEKNLLKAAGDNRGEFLWPLRAALTGTEKSPSPFECTWILGKEESIKRIDKALEILG